MRTPEALFNQIVLGEIPCPCGVRCLAVIQDGKDQSDESDFIVSTESQKEQRIQFFHRTYDRYLYCIMLNVIQRIIIIINSYYGNGTTPIIVKTLPEGSRELVNGEKFRLADASKTLAAFATPSFFKRFQFAETHEELIDMINQNTFQICAYLVKTRRTHKHKLPL